MWAVLDFILARLVKLRICDATGEAKSRTLQGKPTHNARPLINTLVQIWTTNLSPSESEGLRSRSILEN